MNDVIDEINDKHMGPWATLCAADGVGNTPLTPYIHKDSLSKKHIALSGSKLIELGCPDFQNPSVTRELLIEVLQDFVQLKMFPASLMLKSK
jgi:hypothetical protein